MPSSKATSGKSATKVLLIGLSTLAQMGIARLVDAMPRYRVVGAVDGGDEARAALLSLKPDLVLIAADVDPEPLALQKLGTGGARFLWLSPHPNPPTDADSRAFCGFISERAEEVALRVAISAAADCRHRARAAACKNCEIRGELARIRLPLTAREMELFLLIGRSVGPSEAASRMRVSVKTVETYRESIKRKLRIPNASALIVAASLWRHGAFGLPAESSNR